MQSVSVGRPYPIRPSLADPTGQDPGHLAVEPDGSVIIINTTAISVTVFVSQVLHAFQVPQSKAQATQPQGENPGPTAQATSDNAGAGFWAQHSGSPWRSRRGGA
jgi:hypothetical protein